MFTVFAVGLGLRLLFVNGTLRASTTARVWEINRDTRSYRHLAHNLRDEGRYARDDASSRYMALIRPPLYPLVLAGLETSDGLPNRLFWVQAVIGAAVPVGVGWLAWIFYRKRWAVWAAGLLAALSPTGVAIAAVALPDLLFAALFLAGFAVATVAMRGANRRRVLWAAALGAGLLFGAAALTKPAMTYWPAALVPVWWLSARAFGGWTGWGRLAACLAVQGALMLGWCARNYAAEGVFIFSAMPSQNLRNMIVPRVKVWEKLGRAPTVPESQDRYSTGGRQSRHFIRQERHTAAELVAGQMAYGLKVVRDRPWLALRVYLLDVMEQIPARWDVYDRQLRDVPNGGAADPPERRVFDPIFAAGGAGSLPLRWVPFGLAASALALPWLVPKPRRDRAWRRRVGIDLALAATYLYFLALAGTTYAQGTRVMYPAQFAGTLLMVSATGSAARRFHSQVPGVD